MSGTEPSADDGEEHDPSIALDDFVYRRIHETQVTTEPSGLVRPHSGAFEDKDDGMSAFLHSALVAAHGPTAPMLVATDPYSGHGVAKLSVARLRLLGCGVTRDPDPPDVPAHSCNCAHVLVHLPKLGKNADRRLRKELVSAAEWVQQPRFTR